MFPVLTTSVLPGEPVVGETFRVSYHTHQIRNKREDAEGKNLCSNRLCTSRWLSRKVRTNVCFSHPCFSHLFLHPCIGYLVHTWHRLRKSSITVSIASWVLPSRSQCVIQRKREQELITQRRKSHAETTGDRRQRSKSEITYSVVLLTQRCKT